MFDWLKSWTLMATDWPKSWAPMVIDCWTKSWTSRRSRWIPCHLLPPPPRPPLLAFELLPLPPLPCGLALLYSGLEFALVLGEPRPRPPEARARFAGFPGFCARPPPPLIPPMPPPPGGWHRRPVAGLLHYLSHPQVRPAGTGLVLVLPSWRWARAASGEMGLNKGILQLTLSPCA